MAQYQYRKGNIEASGDITAFSAYAPSDERYKTNIEKLVVDIQDFMKIIPVKYEWKPEVERPGTEEGFIAQNVQECFPSMVGQSSITGMLNVNYAKMVALLWSVVQQQEERIKSLEKQLK